MTVTLYRTHPANARHYNAADMADYLGMPAKADAGLVGTGSGDRLPKSK